MRVVHLLPALEQGGVESVVCELNRILTESGHESIVVSKGGRLAARIEADGGKAIPLELKSKNPLTVPFRVWRLRRLLKRLKPDLVCAHSRVPAWLFVLANRPLKLKWISYAHGANSVSRYSEVLTKGDLTIVPSQFLADYLREHYPLDPKRLRVIPNAVDTERFNPENLDRTFVEEKRREWGIRQGERVIMAVGRITPVKGYDDLITRVKPNERLIIVGGAEKHHLKYFEELKAKAGARVVFAGPQTKIPECLSLADVVVSANTVKPESFGLSVVEAYAMNKPVEAKRFGGVAEIMSAVEASGKSTFREAVIDLYGYDKLLERTLVAYKEVTGL